MKLYSRFFLQTVLLPACLLLAVRAHATSFQSIESMTGWTTCSSCALAHGVGPDVRHSLNNATAAPSLDGHSAEFHVDGGFPYASAIWWNQLGGNDNATDFTYDLYFYFTDPAAAQALEFDVNQSGGGRKFIFGTQCGVNYDREWSVWESGASAWRPTGIACSAQPYIWNHLTWQFHRSGGWLQYVSVTLNGQTQYVNRWYESIPWSGSEINVAFQMDQTGAHTPYSVWLDRVSLTY